MDADRQKLNQILPSHPITLQHKSLALPLIHGGIWCTAQALAYGIGCVRICAEVCVSILGDESAGKREREGKDDLGVMRAGKIIVPSGIMGLNLIC